MWCFNDGGDILKIIFGLGNPGKEYNNTRHNIGFEMIDYLYSDFEKSAKKKFNGKYVELLINSEKVLLVKPLTFMNNSGETVKKYVDYFDISTDDILVIHDDMDMELGKIKIVYDSSSGGHNGIKSIEEKLNTKKYLRIKIGISKIKDYETIDYVLGKFSKTERDLINKAYFNLKSIANDFINYDKLGLMNKYNGLNK